MPTREQVMTALLALFSGNGSFQTIARRQVPVPNSPTPTVAVPTAQPAIFLIQTHESTRRSARGAPPIRTWYVQLQVWCKIPVSNTFGVPDNTTPGDTVMNALMETIEGILTPDPTDEVLTLGN